MLSDDHEVLEVPQLHAITAIHDPMNCASLPTRGRSVNLARLSPRPREMEQRLLWREQGHEALCENGVISSEVGHHLAADDDTLASIRSRRAGRRLPQPLDHNDRSFFPGWFSRYPRANIG